MSPSLALFALALPLACGDKDDIDDTGSAGTDSGADGGSGSGVAGLADLSTGECPDMTTSGTSSFSSSDEDRTVTVLLPDPLPDGPMPLVFFFHGLMDPGSTPVPTEYMATALGMQDLADEYGAVVVLPESPTQSMFGLTFFLWDVMEGGAKDLALYDDLRTCAAQQLEIDLDRVVAMGFSGGALFTTMVLSQRADTLAAAIEMSGGADIEVPIYEDPIAPYQTPAWPLPVLLQSGGSTDIWPDASFVIVNFQEGTEYLAGQLADDGSLVVHCEHDRGHTVTNNGYSLAIDWAMGHRFGQDSPWADGDLGGDADWCQVVAGSSAE